MEKSPLEGVIEKSTTSVFDGINQKTEALDLLKKYKKANDDYVRSHVEHVQILGMTSPVKLVDIYSVTNISTTIHRRLYLTEWADLGSTEIRKTINGRKSNLRADEYIENHNRIAILAGPGSGKTTLLKYTALSYIDKSVFENSKLKVSKTPFFVSLPDWIETDLSLEKFIASKIIIKTHEYAEHYVLRQLNKGKAAVLLDSLDEVPLSKRTRAYKEISEFSKNYPNTKILITCRVADYTRTLEGFYEVEIMRLSESAIKKIIRAWFTKTPKKARELIDHLKIDNDVLSLTETPLMLSLLCIQYANDLNIPNRKIELYSRCIDALLRLWDSSRGFRRDSAFSALTDDRKQKLFSEVAYFFTCNRELKYVFSDKEIATIIDLFMERFGVFNSKPKEILDELESHHGIIERYSAESYSFSHTSFQEYFAACALVAKRQEYRFVKENLYESKSSSIIVFMIALMDDPSSIIKYLIEKSQLAGIKTYPAMSTRTEIISLLYRCMNSGVSLSPEMRRHVYQHIVQSQIEISIIYRQSNTYPIARLEHDGVSHTLFYIEKTRSTLGDAILSYKKLSNELLLSPNLSYAEVAIETIDSQLSSPRNYEEVSMKTCLLIPLASSAPEKVLTRLEKIQKNINNDSLFKGLIEDSINKLKDVYLKQEA